jgi:hypothetical protein
VKLNKEIDESHVRARLLASLSWAEAGPRRTEERDVLREHLPLLEGIILGIFHMVI